MSKTLISQFGPLGEHPDFPCLQWLAAATDGNTRQGYWEWVATHLNLQEEPPKVWVVMGNDYPDSVFSTETKAEAFIEGIKSANARIYWRAYGFIVDEKDYPTH